VDYPHARYSLVACGLTKMPPPLGFLSLSSAPQDGRAVLLAYLPKIEDFLKTIEIDVMLARRCLVPATNGWVPLAVDPNDNLACSIGMVEQPLGWLPISVLD
jgi:hypothetical protein